MDTFLLKLFEFPAKILYRLTYFLKYNMQDELENYKGVAEDTRTEEQKALDYTEVEILGGSVVTTNWQEKTSWKILDLRKQITSSSCGAQSSAKALTAFFNEIMSASPIYRPRINFSGEGMVQSDIGNILKKTGTTLESLCSSENMTEDEMNSIVIPTTLPYKISSYYFLPSGADVNMDSLGVALESGHALIIGINSNGQEWVDVPFFNGQPTTFSHYVASVPQNYLIHNNEKSVVIDDSVNAFSSLGGTGQRILSESFLKARSWGIMALIPLSGTTPLKPQYSFNKDLVYGMMGDTDVVKLQDCLKYCNFMPNDIPSTGNFLNATKAAVIKFQNFYAPEILSPVGLTTGTGEVHEYTRQKLNELFS